MHFLFSFCLQHSSKNVLTNRKVSCVQLIARVELEGNKPNDPFFKRDGCCVLRDPIHTQNNVTMNHRKVRVVMWTVINAKGVLILFYIPLCMQGVIHNKYFVSMFHVILIWTTTRHISFLLYRFSVKYRFSFPILRFVP